MNNKETAMEIARRIKERCDEYARGARGVGSDIPLGAVISALDALYHDTLAYAHSRLDHPEDVLTKDAARYRWLNRQHNFLVYIENESQVRQNVRLRCGPPLDEWIDARIEEEKTTPQSRGDSE